MRHTKIVATIGPASASDAVIEAIVDAGVDVVRLNFSHGTPETHREAFARVRAASRRARRWVAVLQDLSGPKIRTGRLERGEPIALEPGDRLVIGIGTFEGRPGLVSTDYAPLALAVRPGDHLLLDDGRIDLRVESTRPEAVTTKVIDGGRLGEHKGINAPHVPLPAAGVTEKDERDLRFGLALGVDLVALSFVQSPDDIARARAIAADAGHRSMPMVAKLERPEAIRRLPDLVDAADAVMIARGDLGLEMPLEEVPQVQKRVLRLTRERGVPVIVATQVLESMRTESRPTRAEVADAAGAVDAGADAIMLSGETAIGGYPVRTVQVLDRIIRSAEAVPPPWALPAPSDERPDHLPPLCDAAVTLASRGRVNAIIAVTRLGRTARLLAARRPPAPIIAVTPSEEVARRLSLWWGITPTLDTLEGDMDAIVSRVVSSNPHVGQASGERTVVVVSASPDLSQPGANYLRLRRV